MDTLSKGDVLVLDQAYFSYLVLYQAKEKIYSLNLPITVRQGE